MQRRKLILTPFAAGLAACGGGGDGAGGDGTTPPVANQALISGQLTVRQPGQSLPVAQATVFVQASDRLFETTTDAFGNYSVAVDASAFRNPAPFDIMLSAWKAGFAPLRIYYPAPIVAGLSYGPPVGLDPSAFWMIALPPDAYSSLAFSRRVHLGRDVPLEAERFLSLKTQGDSWSAVVFDWSSADNGRLRYAQLFLSLLGVDGSSNTTKGRMVMTDANGQVFGMPISLDFDAYPGSRYPSFWTVPLPASLPAGPVRVTVTTGADAAGADAMEVWGGYVALRATPP